MDEIDELTRRVLEVIKSECKKQNIVFFEKSCKNEVKSWLESGGKYEALSKWLNKTIEFNASLLNIYSPIDYVGENGYTKGMAKRYMEIMGEIGTMIHLRELLLDTKCSDERRESISVTVGKLFGVHYNKYLKEYV